MKPHKPAYTFKTILKRRKKKRDYLYAYFGGNKKKRYSMRNKNVVTWLNQHHHIT